MARSLTEPFFLERYAAVYRAELDAFIDAVTGGKPVKPDGEGGLSAQSLADAVTDSARAHKAISLSGEI
jgi:myo-inositol 2-dehydrogenase / D-chiro-inositol 1-dehydrogenase